MSTRTFGFDLTTFADNRKKCVHLCANYLNKGKLGLVLGAGASKALKLPDWYDLLTVALKSLAVLHTLPPKKDYTNQELKEAAGKVKRHFGANTNDYLDLIQGTLYDGFKPNFANANKDLLIALSTLFVGKKRGNVTSVVTYNFDSVLEWYLDVVGLSSTQLGNNYIAGVIPDVEILHLHGYLPHSPDFGKRSSDILLTKKDFEDRQVGSSHYKTIMADFYQRHLFITVGMSATSIVDDICPYLRQLHDQNGINKITRDQPFGVALISDCSEEERLTMIEDGIIPLVEPTHDEIPNIIFEIAQDAVKRP